MKQINFDRDKRTTLSHLRAEIKSDASMAEELSSPEYIARILDCLSDTDAKTRKNAALLLGDLANNISSARDVEATGNEYQKDETIDSAEIAKALWNAYQTDETKFVKSSYLHALARFDYSNFREGLCAEQKKLQTAEIAPEDQKHIREILRELDEIVATFNREYHYRGISRKHAVLLTAQSYIHELLAEEVKRKTHLEPRVTKRGIRVTTSDLEPLYQIRIYEELLFVLRQRADTAIDIAHLGVAIVESELLSILREMYGDEESYPFRLHTSVQKLNLKSIADEIAEASAYRLYNSTKHALVDIEIVKKADGGFLFYGNFFNANRNRFRYRMNILPTATSPVIAAQMIALISPYLTQNAHVLDPFCGLGTLLIERELYEPASHLYGVDTYGEAILMARDEATFLNKENYFINRNYFDFTITHAIEEIITEFPHMQDQNREVIDEFYARFFDKSAEIVSDGGMLFAFTTEEAIMKKQLRLHKEFSLVRQIPMRGKEQIYIFTKRGAI